MTLDISNITFPISPSPDATEFWAGLNRGDLLLPYCTDCEAFFWYPRTSCPECGSRSIEWRTASGRGVVHSFCIIHQSPLPHLKDLLPVVTALVDLNEGPRMMGLLDIEPDPAAVRVGATVTLDIRASGDGQRVALFRPSAPTSTTSHPTGGTP